MADAKLADYERRLNIRIKEFRFARKRIHALRAAIAKRKKQLAPKAPIGQRAVQHALKTVGATEVNNRAPWLDRWIGKYHQPWMKGQPWCGLACIVWWARAGKKLPLDTVSTVAIANRAARGDGFSKVPIDKIQAGDLIVMHFGSGGPKHVGLARGPMKNGVVNTVEGNTSPSNGGSQANGGGIYLRTRARGLIHTVARPK